jgi:hypothetical protein
MTKPDSRKHSSKEKSVLNSNEKHELASIEEDALLGRCLRDPIPGFVQPENLAEMAKQFANQLPEEIFSPADIQGFLLTKKVDPEGALREVDKWKEEQLKEKKLERTRKAKQVVEDEEATATRGSKSTPSITIAKTALPSFNLGATIIGTPSPTPMMVPQGEPSRAPSHHH